MPHWRQQDWTGMLLWIYLPIYTKISSRDRIFTSSAINGSLHAIISGVTGPFIVWQYSFIRRKSVREQFPKNICFILYLWISRSCSNSVGTELSFFFVHEKVNRFSFSSRIFLPKRSKKKSDLSSMRYRQSEISLATIVNVLFHLVSPTELWRRRWASNDNWIS